jgi:catechol 2,3-dioxygenase-like lactoylglutathione lyase family enzyme
LIDVTRVDYVRVPVDDIEKARHFYGEVLGLPRNEHLAGLDDPAGNRILLHHRYAPYGPR